MARTPQIIVSRETQLDDLERLSRNLRERRATSTNIQERRMLTDRIEATEAAIREIR